MKAIRIAITAAMAVGLAGSASAQLSVNCSVAGGCRVDKYGLHAPDSYGKESDPVFEITNPGDTPLARDFAGSYAFQKDTSDPNNPQCDGEGGFVPVFGQIMLREQANCVPTDTVGCPVEIATDLNPSATEGGSATESWFADSRLIFVNADFGAFQVQMTISTASHGRMHGFGQRFRIGAGPATRIRWDRIGTDSRLQDPTDPSDNFTRGDTRSKVCCNFQGGFNLCGASGLSVYPVITDTQALGSVLKNIPDWVFVGGPGTNWQTDPNFTPAGQKHGICSGAGFPDDVSRAHRRIGCDITGPGDVDECNNAAATCNTSTGFCNTGAGQHITTEVECTANADCDLNDVCDLRDGGYRLQRSSTAPPPAGEGSAIGSCENNTAIACTQAGNECAAVGGACSVARFPNPDLCGQALFFFRGTANNNCSIVDSFLKFSVCEALAGPTQEAGCIVPAGVVGRRRGVCGLRALGSTGAFTPVTPNVACELDGDPGTDCMGRNYGPVIRPDVNCNGTIDAVSALPGVTDLCPNYNETDPFTDTNGDGRGNECQCGDPNRDGRVTVADIVSTNILIFVDPAAGTGADGRYRISAPLCDSTGDDRCNVSDIVGTNLEVFSPGYSARCFRSPCADGLTSCTSTGAPL